MFERRLQENLPGPIRCTILKKISFLILRIFSNDVQHIESYINLGKQAPIGRRQRTGFLGSMSKGKAFGWSISYKSILLKSGSLQWLSYKNPIQHWEKWAGKPRFDSLPQGRLNSEMLYHYVPFRIQEPSYFSLLEIRLLWKGKAPEPHTLNLPELHLSPNWCGFSFFLPKQRETKTGGKTIPRL
jgi:hypothetical protein